MGSHITGIVFAISVEKICLEFGIPFVLDVGVRIATSIRLLIMVIGIAGAVLYLLQRRKYDNSTLP